MATDQPDAPRSSRSGGAPAPSAAGVDPIAARPGLAEPAAVGPGAAAVAPPAGVSDRSVLIATGALPDDAALWRGLLRLVHEGSGAGAEAGATSDAQGPGAGGQSDGRAYAASGSAAGTGAPPAGWSGPVAWAVDDVDTAVAQLRSLLAAGMERALVVPFVTAGDGQRAAWARQLAREVADLRMRYPEARLDDVGPVTAPEADVVPGLLTVPQDVDASLVADAIGRAFDGDPARLARFVAALREGLPPGASIALRGSAVMGSSFRAGIPFDAAGPGTSDLDIVLVGDEVERLWVPEARMLGGLNTLPLDDRAPWVAPAVDPARRAAQAVVSRPTAVQAMAGWFLALRALVQGQSYVVLSGPA